MNPTTPPSSSQATIGRRFFERAATAQTATALRGEFGRVSYGELAQAAHAVAFALRARGIGRGNRVGIHMQRSPEAIAAILGILASGAAYVPFDPGYPRKLLRYIRDDATPALLLTDKQPCAGEPEFDGSQCLPVAELLKAHVDIPVELPAVDGDDPAYVMYTSGSTGRPKGVEVPHRAVLRLVSDNPYADFGPEQVFLHLAPLSFDASTFEIWGALLNGGTLAIVADAHPTLERIADAIARYHVTTAWLTAGLFHLMVEQRLDGLLPLRQLLAGGDVLSPSHVERLLRAAPGLRLVNGYGPTENTTFTCCHDVTLEDAASGRIPIGLPIAHTQVHVLDEALQQVADGDIGELYAGGDGVALGYLNRPQLNAERFLPDPFSNRPGARMYRTGDRVRRRPDGVLEFLGRADRQIKIDGKRVELDEIETCLRRSPLVADAAVVTYEAAGRRRVAAYVTAAPAQTAAPETLRDWLRGELPDYMIPAQLRILDTLPLSPTGKVDRARLPLPETETPSAAPVPTGAEEATLLGIWREVLGRGDIGLDDNFFDLGGSSLQLIQIHALIGTRMQRQLGIVDLFRYPRIRALAEWLRREPGAAAAEAHTERARGRNAALARIRARHKEKVT